MAGVLFYLLAVLEKHEAPVARLGQQLDYVAWFLSMDRVPTVDVGRLILPAWTLAFARLFQVELLLVVITAAKFGSDLISGDLRTNALPIYFSKPVTTWTYLLGKWLVAVAFMSSVVLLPNLVAYASGVLLSGGLDRVAATAGLLARVLCHSLLVVGIAGLMILALSSLTRDKRIVMIAWVGVVLLSMGVQQILDTMADGPIATGPLGCVSLYRVFGRLGYWVLGVEDAVSASGHPGLLGRAAGSATLGEGIGWALAVAGGLVVVCLAVCLARVRRFQVAVANA
jgi:ABC-type transport system involved in multi-copper enzyme maturation permease subunit